jgi:uncharacterized protein (UPF0332 family)
MFDWSKYVDLARELVQRFSSEEFQRSGISRAYYAVFHAARDYLDRKGPPVARHGAAHAEVRRRIAREDWQMGMRLRRLHNWRTSADYDDVYPGPLIQEARSSVRIARQLLRDIAKLK